ncbi:MAG: GerMN domain-containing protein [Chloroflexi bacterium]|nr:GerMN domain-containing protein [Chloroflexota bacterium]
MGDPAPHCPFLGLKQNRAIRFASPTPAHRCYLGGDAVEIPVDQRAFCLSAQFHRCPLYEGMRVSATERGAEAGARSRVAAPMRVDPIDRATGGARRLPRQLPLVLAATALLAMVLVAGGVLLLPTLLSGRAVAVDDAPTRVADAAAPAVPRGTGFAATVTELATGPGGEQPALLPPVVPTDAVVRPQMTRALEIATATPAAATATPAAATATPAAATATPAAATATPAAATATPPAVASAPTLAWLYFQDITGTVLTPAQRVVQPGERGLAEAVLGALIAGPRGQLQPVLNREARINAFTVDGDTAIIDLDREPWLGDPTRGFDAIVLTLTHIAPIARVELRVNGATVIGATARPLLNPINPAGVPNDVTVTTYLPLYAFSIDGTHTIRFTWLVPKTRQPAAETVEALLAGIPGYAPILAQALPSNTVLRGVTIESAIATINLSSAFGDAPDRSAAVRVLVESLTSFPSIQGVTILVEGRPLEQLWGEGFIGPFVRPIINHDP